jgi:hypothetical protein
LGSIIVWEMRPYKARGRLAEHLVREWHPTKNGALGPQDVGPTSPVEVWWRCSRDPRHEWKSPVKRRLKRVRLGRGCPICRGFLVTLATSLAGRYPDLARQWHESANGDLTPHVVAPGSHRKIWWRCPEGADHIWQASINSRTRGGGCPFCVNARVSMTNCLATKFPSIAAEWHPSRNGALTATDVRPAWKEKVWWLCRVSPEHEWQATPYYRTHYWRTGCPYCPRKPATAAESLATRHPDLAAEWHPTRNGRLSPDDVHPASHFQAWWRCVRDPRHVWNASVANRARGAGCSICANRKFDATNSLATLEPALAAQWHPTKNRRLTPDQVGPGSGKRVWWKCAVADDHVWRTTILSRSQGRGCPFCSHRYASRDHCLAKLFPKLARQWHPTKNGKLRPQDVVPGSHRRVWWQCASGHAWAAPVHKRTTEGRGCPHCRVRKPRPATTRRIRRRVWLPSDWS